MQKALIISLSIIFFGTIDPTFAQQSKDPACEELTNAADYYCKNKFRKTVKTLEGFVKGHPGHELFEEALYGIGKAHKKRGKRKKAEKAYRQLIGITDYPEKETLYDYSRCMYLSNGCNGILQPKRLLELQHEACKDMAEMAMLDKDFKNAHNYIHKAENYYRYWYGCGTGDMENDLMLALLYAEMYGASGKMDSAIAAMLPHALEASAMPIKHYPILRDKLVMLLQTEYPDQLLKDEMESALEHLYFETFKEHHGEGRTYFIKMFGIPIKVAPEYLFNKTKDLNKVRDYIRKSVFYKNLTKSG